MKKVLLIVIGAFVLLCGIGVVVAAASGNDSPKSTVAPPTFRIDPTTASVATTKADDGSISRDGTFAVGAQVRPGTYAANVPDDSFGCYWERLKDASGQMDGIITNGNGDAGSQMTVQIKATDKFFHTQGCGAWKRVG